MISLGRGMAFRENMANCSFDQLLYIGTYSGILSVVRRERIQIGCGERASHIGASIHIGAPQEAIVLTSQTSQIMISES